MVIHLDFGGVMKLYSKEPQDSHMKNYIRCGIYREKKVSMRMKKYAFNSS